MSTLNKNHDDFKWLIIQYYSSFQSLPNSYRNAKRAFKCDWKRLWGLLWRQREASPALLRWRLKSLFIIVIIRGKHRWNISIILMIRMRSFQGNHRLTGISTKNTLTTTIDPWNLLSPHPPIDPNEPLQWTTCSKLSLLFATNYQTSR